MKIYKCGTNVNLIGSGLDGIITQIAIRFEVVTYEVSYWYQGEHKSTWVNEIEFTPKSDRKQSIGFK